MELRILVDTNILLDYLLDREPHEKSARTIIKACQQKKMEGCVAAHSITNIFIFYEKTLALKNAGIYC